MEPGCVVEFIESQKIICAVVLEVKKLRLRLLTENNRETKLSAGRLSQGCGRRLDLSMGREKLAAALKEIAALRRGLSEQINITELWDVLKDERQWIDPATMASLCFTEQTTGDHESAVMRAFFEDRLHFKFSLEGFFPHTEEQVEQIKAQREAQVHREALIESGGAWVQRTLKGHSPPQPQQAHDITQILISYFLFEKDSPHRDIAKAVCDRAGVATPSALFNFLVRTGVWHPNENLDLLRFQVSVELPAAVEAQAQLLCAQPLRIEPQRRDLRDWPVVTIDGAFTLDFDDALSLQADGDHWLIGIHIADVAHYIRKGDAIDQEAQARASTIYLPDQKIPMLPACLSDDILSLKADLDRPAISTLIRVNGKAEVIDYEIVPSLIRVQRQLTYQDVDGAIDHDPILAQLQAIAMRYRNKRLDNGALIIELPEIAIRLNNEAPPAIARMDREGPGRMLVSEMMILANDITARFLSSRQLPAIYRSQPEPRERLFERDAGTLFQNWMQRKLINRFILSSTPEPHAGLGLPAYVTSTSPIRKYSDLVTQRQLRAALGFGSAYTKEEMDFIIASLEQPMGVVGRVQFRRHRYWLLKHLETCIGQKKEALVLGKRREGYAILLPDYMLECTLSGADHVKLKPEDLVQVTFQHVHARNDVLTVVFG